jgi:tripartite-type tricarboxylate transporter receptor subunit TctC
MEKMLPRASFATLLLAALVAAPDRAPAQTYPSKLVTIVVPVAPGGVSDTFARGLAQRLTQTWGQQVIVENRPGAQHVIGAAAVAKATPDGYTLLLTEGTAMIPSLYSRLPYDPVTDFAPISGLIGIYQSVVVHPALPVHTLRELIEFGKTKSGGINFGNFGAGAQLGMELLQSATGMKLVPVQYKGSAPMITDLIAGHLDLSTFSVGTAAGLWRDGKVKLLAVTAGKRLPQLPEIPTIAETVPGFETAYWFGLFAPRGTPNDVVARINAEVQRILVDHAFSERFVTRQMFQALKGSPEQFADYIKADVEKWERIARDGKVKLD